MLNVILSYSKIKSKEGGCVVRNDVIKYNYLVELWASLDQDIESKS